MKFCVVFLTTFYLSGCDIEENLGPRKQYYSEPSVVDGRLKFNSIQDLVSFVDESKKYDFEEVKKSISKLAWDTIVKHLGAKSKKGATVITGVDPFQNRFYFLYADWHKNNKNDNRIINIFDWNSSEVGFTTTIGVPNSTCPVYKVSKSYKDFAISCYGIGRRGSEWRGGSIVLVQN